MKLIIRNICAVAVLLAAPGALFAEDAEIARGPVPGWAVLSDPLPTPAQPGGGLGFFNAQDTLIHLDADGQTTLIAQRFTLLNPQALQLGNVTIAWNPAAGAPTVHTLQIRRGGETIDVLDKAKFEILRREDELEAAKLTGTLTAVLKVPDLRVGDELDLVYSVPSQDPTLKSTSAGLLVLPGSVPAGRYRMGLSWDKGQKPIIHPSADLAGKLQESAQGIDIRFDNPAPADPPKDAPPRYAWMRVLEFTDFPSFADMSRRFAPLFATAATLPAASPIKAEAARIAAASSDPLARAQAALELVQQQVRYIYVGLDGGNFQPATADETWQRRYGDCKGKTALLLALLSELGVAAEPVLVNSSGSDDGFDVRLAQPALFDHVVVRASIGGKRYWLDGTLPAVATASERPDLPYHFVLPLTASGSDLEKLPWAPAAKPDTMELYDIDAAAGFDEPARITTTSIARGPDALVQYMKLSALTDDQLLQAFRSSLQGSAQWDTIETVSYRYDVPARAGVLKVVGKGPVDWDKNSDGGRSLDLPGGGFIPPDRRQRSPDQDQAAPFYLEPSFTCYVTTVRLPKDTDPAHWDYNTTFDTAMFGRVFYRMMERRGDTFRMVRGSRVERTETTAEQATRDNARLARFDNSKARLTYSPSEVAAEPRGMTPVPATDEGDWLNAPQYCLPPDLRS